MTRYMFPYEDYYKSSFIDPLYLPYIKRNVFPINPYTMNINEIRYNLGQTFKKKYSHYPCPMGFKNKGIDYCERFTPPVPIFYTNYVDNIIKDELPHQDFIIKQKPNFNGIYVSSVYPGVF